LLEREGLIVTGEAADGRCNRRKHSGPTWPSWMERHASIRVAIRAPLYCGQPSSPIRNYGEEEVCLDRH
jgi:hypothetical protein